MPFTVSHVAAVLPLRYGRAGLLLATPPLVIGSMAPDTPSVVGARQFRDLTHTLVASMTVDVAVTGVGCLVWAFVLRPVVADLVPGLAARWGPLHRSERTWPTRAALWYLAAAIGCFTHVLWDAFTHAGGASRSWIPFQRIDVWIFETLQVVSSIVGLLILLWWSVRWWRSHPPVGREWHDHSPARTVHRRRMGLAVGVVLGATVWAALARVLDSSQPIEPLRVLVNLGFGALAGALVSALLVAVVYRLTLLRHVPSA
ncbi:DUF4184 family protein [Angustibacter sp. McL0619]|uniref:DUF4184 family protein n=1 Tax=Angustibacter sp. McL0619 TaxID=3415676 RepID=UPI003CE76B1D